MISDPVTGFAAALDKALAAHLDWTRRLLRFALIGEAPAADMFELDAHERCRFGQWFASARPTFRALDPMRATALEVAHRQMHDATRALCFQVLSGETRQKADVDAFETYQAELIEHLTRFKELALVQARAGARSGA